MKKKTRLRNNYLHARGVRQRMGLWRVPAKTSRLSLADCFSLRGASGLAVHGLVTSGTSSGKWFSRWMSLTGKDHTHRAHPCSQPVRRNILDCDSSQKVRGFTGFAHFVVDSLQNGRCTLSRFLLIPIQAATPTRNSCRIFLWLA